MTARASAQTLGALTVVFGTYLTIANIAGLQEPWVGLLFVFYWAMIEGADVDKLPSAVVGAAVGSTVGLMPTLAGKTVGSVLLLAGVYALIHLLNMGSLPTAVNPGAMLFLSVMTIPHVGLALAPLDAYLSLAVAVAVFGGGTLLGHKMVECGQTRRLFRTQKEDRAVGSPPPQPSTGSLTTTGWSYAHGVDGSGPRPAFGPDSSMPVVRSLSKRELYVAAQRLEIPGRSVMDKEQLAKAIAEHRTSAEGAQ